MRVEGGTIRWLSPEILMSIITQLNEELAKYRSPKVNWLTKRPVLLGWMAATSAIATFFLLLPLFHSVPSFFNMSSLIVALSTTVGVLFVPLCTVVVFSWLEKQQTPKRERVVKKYTKMILEKFSESEDHDIKIKLLKILNDEPYTPVSFLEGMFALKRNLVAEKQAEQRQKDKPSVNDYSNLTVLIEQLEQRENANQVAKNEIRDQKLKSVFKL